MFCLWSHGLFFFFFSEVFHIGALQNRCVLDSESDIEINEVVNFNFITCHRKKMHFLHFCSFTDFLLFFLPDEAAKEVCYQRTDYCSVKA